MNTQKISALKAPVIIEGLRKKIKALQQQNLEYKKVFRRQRKVFRGYHHKSLFQDLRTELRGREYAVYEENRNRIYADSSLNRATSKAKVEDAHMQYEEVTERKLHSIRKLFDFRKKQDLETLKIEAQKIINS